MTHFRKGPRRREGPQHRRHGHLGLLVDLVLQLLVVVPALHLPRGSLGDSRVAKEGGLRVQGNVTFAVRHQDALPSDYSAISPMEPPQPAGEWLDHLRQLCLTVEALLLAQQSLSSNHTGHVGTNKVFMYQGEDKELSGFHGDLCRDFSLQESPENLGSRAKRSRRWGRSLINRRNNPIATVKEVYSSVSSKVRSLRLLGKPLVEPQHPPPHCLRYCTPKRNQCSQFFWGASGVCTIVWLAVGTPQSYLCEAVVLPRRLDCYIHYWHNCFVRGCGIAVLPALPF